MPDTGLMIGTTPIDGTVEAATQLAGSLTGSGQHLTATRLLVETIDVDSITETAIISIGTNSPNYDNVVAAHPVRLEPMSLETVPIPHSKMITEGSMHVRVVRAASGTELTFNAGIDVLNYAFT